jgi:hypothetical protein
MPTMHTNPLCFLTSLLEKWRTTIDFFSSESMAKDIWLIDIFELRSFFISIVFDFEILSICWILFLLPTEIILSLPSY